MAIQDQPWFIPNTRTEEQIAETEIVSLIINKRIELAIERFFASLSFLSDRVGDKLINMLIRASS